MVEPVDDSTLVTTARDGDLASFEELVRRHQSPVYRVALRMLGSRADAEDVAQETFVQAWRSLSKFRGESAFGTWLYRIATNRSLNVLAGRRADSVPIDDELLSAAVGTDEEVEQRLRLQATVTAILTLEPEQRALIVLRELEGLGYAEIGEILGLGESLVKGRLHRARLVLVATVEEE
ncbi:MAG TPA: sigma-70 family RNA polymerase sigma factor [Solirubrobacterales bacterium]